MGEKKIDISYDDVTQKLEELPTLPTIVYELTRIINDPMSSTKEVEDIMENDVISAISSNCQTIRIAVGFSYSVPRQLL